MNNFLIPKGFIFRFVDSPKLYGNSETEWLYQLTILQKNLNSTSFLNSISSWLSFSIDTDEEGGNPELRLTETSHAEKDKTILSIKIDVKDEELFDKNAYLQIKLYNDVKVSYIIQILEKLKLINFNCEIIFPLDFKELININNLRNSFSLNSKNKILHNYTIYYYNSLLFDDGRIVFKITKDFNTFPYTDLKKIIYSIVTCI